ncbi:MAG: Uma2 family endonuclease [Acidobacteriia bacterium]|nr:Uma2 family endonuclease [Terriglobia bacterium]
MSAAPLPPLPPAAEALPRKRFTRAEVDHLMEGGFFEGQRYELIDGDLIDKIGQNPPHAQAIRLVHRWLSTFLETDLIQTQLPIEVSAQDRERSLPEPDLAVLAEFKSDYARRHPRGDELRMVIEVSDTTVQFDLSRKAALYSLARVPEYWVLDLPRRTLVVHRQPSEAGYRLIQLFGESDAVSLENGAETASVSEFLPPGL